MKTISALLLVLAYAGLGGATDFCAPQLKSCASLPQSSAKACSSLIAKSGLKLTTCSKAKSTVTKTSTIQPSTTRTVIVTKTVSLNIATNVQRTVLKTATSTEVSKNTLTQTETSTTQTTSVVPQTTTVTESETETTTATSSIPYQRETCAADTPAVRKRRADYKAWNPIPRDCSCYLTTTKQCNQPTRTWSTVTKPTATAYVTLFKFTTLTKYNTKTVDVLQTATKIATTVLTDVSTTTVGITETIPATSVVATATATTTATMTAVQTVQADPCADPVLYTDVRPNFPIAFVGALSDSNNPKDCCHRCFSTNAGCLYWRFSNQVCYQYVIPNSAPALSCVTKNCRKGRPALISAPGDGATYGVGICAGAGGFGG